MPLNIIILAAAMVWSFLAGQVLAGVLIGLIALTGTAASVSIVFLSAVRITRKVRSGQPAEIMELFRPRRPPEVDEGLPPDAFVGFDPGLIVRVFDWRIDFWAHSSAVHRVLRGRRRFSGNVSGSSR
jgi:hypothetical protein